MHIDELLERLRKEVYWTIEGKKVLEKLRERVRHLCTEIGRRNETLAAYKKSVEELTSEVEAARAAADSAKAEKDEIHKDYLHISENLRILEEEHSALQQQSTQLINSLEAEIRELKASRERYIYERTRR